MTLQTLIIAAGTILFFVLVALAFAGPNSSKATTRRLGAVKMRHSDSADARVEQQMRKAVASRRPLIFADGQHINRADKLRLRLAQTGKKWTLSQYMTSCAVVFLLTTLFLLMRGFPFLLALMVGLAAGLALPHLWVGRLINKRIQLFNAKFPDALELLVRGLRSGLPVTETLGVVAQEVPGPVGYEFKTVIDRIKVGKTMEDALQDTADKLGIAEFNFFTITLAIQRETGGNLAETLSNLADVLRKRAQMKLKIKAMSSESKASAYIVGSLPFIVFGMIMWVNPEYIGGFFTDDRLIVAGLGGLCWMGIGVFIMAKMVNFEI